MKKLHVLTLLHAFPDLLMPLFTYTGDIVALDVLEALFIHDISPSDEVTLHFLKKFIQEYIQVKVGDS